MYKFHSRIVDRSGRKAIPLPVRAARMACPFTLAGMAWNRRRPTSVGIRSAWTTLLASKPIFSLMRSRQMLHACGCPLAAYGFTRSESSLLGPCKLHPNCQSADIVLLAE